MKPSFWSKLANEEINLGWYQDGKEISYEPSIYAKEINELNPKL